MAATFSAGGLASGLDSNTIIDKLVELRSGKVTQLKTKKSAYQSQVSVVADLASKLSAFKTAAAALQSGGALGVAVSSAPTGMSVKASTSAQSGRYSVQVDSLASAAKARSTAFANGGAPVTGGTLGISISGDSYSVNIPDGASLSEVATAINGQVGKVSATVLSNGTSSYLSITNRDTGFTVGGQASDALVITEQSTGTAGQPLGLGITAGATNAKLNVDGLQFERSSNIVSDVLPGVTMTLTGQTTVPDELVLGNDVDTTKANLQGFVDAYNTVLTALQKQLAVLPLTDRQYTLSGDGALKGIQSAMQSLVSKVIPGSTSVRSLADLGIKSARDGQLSIDSPTLEKAIARAPSAVNALFATATDGLGDFTKRMVDGYTNSVDGILTVRTSSLNKSVNRLGTDIDNAQRGVDAYRDQLTKQYTAMETIVSGLKSIGSYLTSQEAAKNK